MTSTKETNECATIPLSSLSIQEKATLKRNLETEIDSLTNHVVDLRIAMRRLDTSKNSLKALEKESCDNEVLIPLTQSVYVPGKIESVDKVLIDIGTGYYTEKTISSAEKYFDDKLKVVNDIYSKALKAIAEKKRFVGVMQQECQAATSR